MPAKINDCLEHVPTIGRSKDSTIIVLVPNLEVHVPIAVPVDMHQTMYSIEKWVKSNEEVMLTR